MASIKKLFIPICFLFCSAFSKGQEQNVHNRYLEAIYQYGFLWQHSPSMADIAGGNIHSLQLLFGQKTYGKSYWEQLYRYPERGIGYSFVYLGNSKNLGRANSLYYYFRIPVITRPRFSLSYKISAGLAYLQQENIAIGSHLNLYFDLSLDSKIRLSDNLELVNCFGANHYSNGAIKMPNLGVNLFSYRIGLLCKLTRPYNENLVQELPSIEKRNIISTVVSVGTKEKRPDGNKPFKVASASIDYLYQLNLKHKIGVGLDVFYDQTLFDLMNPDSILVIPWKDVMRYGVHLAFEAQIYRLVLGINLGTYFYAKYTKDGLIYQRIALKYLISKNFFINVSLKANKQVADFVEWGVGYRMLWNK